MKIDPLISLKKKKKSCTKVLNVSYLYEISPSRPIQMAHKISNFVVHRIPEPDERAYNFTKEGEICLFEAAFNGGL
jgi:hypothetical protein